MCPHAPPCACQVYCWLADRDGAGWTFAMKNWYQNTAQVQENDYGSVDDAALMKIKQSSYKLSDRKIQAVIGQTPGTASTFDVMGDQAGINTAYSYYNAEYTVRR